MKTLTLIGLAMLAGILAVTIAFYDRLPDPMPVHFDLHGRADGWGSRTFGVTLLPAVAVAILLWSRFAKSPPMALALSATALFLLSLHALVLRASLDGSMMLGGGLAVLLGLFDIVMGLVFPRLRRNRFVGIRLPWTLGSDENWARTHRFGGTAFVVGGVVTLVSVAIVGAAAAVPVALLVLIGISLVCAGYSYRIAHPAG